MQPTDIFLDQIVKDFISKKFNQHTIQGNSRGYGVDSTSSISSDQSEIFFFTKVQLMYKLQNPHNLDQILIDLIFKAFFFVIYWFSTHDRVYTVSGHFLVTR